MMPILFDLDGVIADNLAFEEAVTKCIIEELAKKRNIPVAQARTIWLATLEENRDHPRWHDYGLHCESLSLGQVWKWAHEVSAANLIKFEGIDAALSAAARIGPLWIASDATEWVVQFKLGALGVSGHFSEVFTVTRCSNHKGSQYYWEHVAGVLGGCDHPIVFIDNRADRIWAAQSTLRRCQGVLVEADDHPVRMGFGSGDLVSRIPSLLESTHNRLADTLITLKPMLQDLT